MSSIEKQIEETSITMAAAAVIYRGVTDAANGMEDYARGKLEQRIKNAIDEQLATPEVEAYIKARVKENWKNFAEHMVVEGLYISKELKKRINAKIDRKIGAAIDKAIGEDGGNP